MPRISNELYCGEFYSDATDCGRFVGFVYRIPGGYVIRIKAEFSGKTIDQSAPFPGNAFRRFRVLNLGYRVVNCYTAAAASA